MPLRADGFFGNSRFEWTPVDSGSSRSVDSTVFEVSSPWVICGGNVSASFAPPSGQCGIDFTVDAANATAWQHVWSGSCESGVSEMLDELIQPHQKPNQGVYNYSLRLRLPSDVKASRLKIVTDVMANPLSVQ